MGKEELELKALRSATCEQDSIRLVTALRLRNQISFAKRTLTLILLTWRIWRAPNNARRWQMGFNSAVKGLTDISL